MSTAFQISAFQPSAFQERIAYTIVPDGGMVWGGETISKTRSSHAPEGGIIWGGAATAKAIDANDVFGGIVWGGEATVKQVAKPVPAGGLVWGGEAGNRIKAAFVPDGGVVFGGAGDVAWNYHYPPPAIQGIVMLALPPAAKEATIKSITGRPVWISGARTKRTTAAAVRGVIYG